MVQVQHLRIWMSQDPLQLSSLYGLLTCGGCQHSHSYSRMFSIKCLFPLNYLLPLQRTSDCTGMLLISRMLACCLPPVFDKFIRPCFIGSYEGLRSN